MREAREDIRLQQAISATVANWEQRGKPADRLYRGSQLKEAQAWARRNIPSRNEVAFLRASATRRIRSLVGVIVAVLLLVSSLGIAGWFVFFQPSKTLVTTLQDNNGVGSLRWCINNAPSGSTIRFAQGLSGTIELTGGDLVFAGGKRLTITGPGANQLAISGGNTGAIIRVSKGATLNVSSLSFKNSETVNDAFLFNEGTLAIANSIVSANKRTVYVSSYGGGIENKGTLIVSKSTISNNSTSGGILGEGGGIDNEGKLTVIKSTFSGNSVSGGIGYGYGGGIFNHSTGTLTVTNTTFLNNSASSSGRDGGAQGGGIDNDGNLTVTQSTFSHNSASSSNNTSFGGGIYNYRTGALVVTGSAFSGNLASSKQNGQGGGIDNAGKLTVTGSTFSSNSASSSDSNAFGGGIYNYTTGTLMVTASTFSHNFASGKQYGAGGGINSSGKLTMVNSTFSNNSASSSDSSSAGGGISNDHTGTVIVSGSTFLYNTASGKQEDAGGGIYTDGKLTIINSTLSNNTASGSKSHGGAIGFTGSQGSSTLIRFSTLYANSSATGGGGIWIDPAGSSLLKVSNSIIVANNAYDGPDISGSFVSDGYNLVENVSGARGLNTTTDKQVALAALKIGSTLRNYGGSTHTLALLPGSPAIDAIPSNACSITVTDPSGQPMTITTDQRGDRRPDGSEDACDIGAYESSY